MTYGTIILFLLYTSVLCVLRRNWFRISCKRYEVRRNITQDQNRRQTQSCREQPCNSIRQCNLHDLIHFTLIVQTQVPTLFQDFFLILHERLHRQSVLMHFSDSLLDQEMLCKQSFLFSKVSEILGDVCLNLNT